MTDKNETGQDGEGDYATEEDGKGLKNEAPSPFHEPPDWVMEDPDYKKAFMEQSAQYVFEQRLVNYQGQYDGHVAIQTKQVEIIRDAGANAGRATLMLNGFAAGGLLTFMGNAESAMAAAFVPALLCFAFGAAMGACLFAFTYVSQLNFTEKGNKPRARIYRSFAIACFVIGMAAFVGGVVVGGLAFQPTTPKSPEINMEPKPAPPAPIKAPKPKPATTN